MSTAIISCVIGACGLAVTCLGLVVKMAKNYTELRVRLEMMGIQIESQKSKSEENYKEFREKLNSHQTDIAVTQSKLDNIEKNVENINLKLDKLLGINQITL